MRAITLITKNCVAFARKHQSLAIGIVATGALTISAANLATTAATIYAQAELSKSPAYTLNISSTDLITPVNVSAFEWQADSPSQAPTILDWVEGVSSLAKAAVLTQFKNPIKATQPRISSNLVEDNNANHDISIFDVLSTYASIASNNAHANAMSRYNKHTPELEVLKLGREIRDLNAVTGEISRPIFVNSEMSNKTRESITSTHAYARSDSACQVNIDEPQLRAIDAKINHGNLQKDLIKKIAIQHEIAHCSDPFVQFVNSTNNTPDSVGHSKLAARMLSEITHNADDVEKVATFLQKYESRSGFNVFAQQLEKYADVYAWIMAARYGWTDTNDIMSAKESATQYNSSINAWTGFRYTDTKNHKAEHYTTVAVVGLKQFNYDIISKLNTSQSQSLAMGLSLYSSVYSLIEDMPTSHLPQSLAKLKHTVQSSGELPVKAIADIISAHTQIPQKSLNDTLPPSIKTANSRALGLR